MSGWIGVDLDGTLARYDGWVGEDHIGEPVLPMLEKVKEWIRNGRTVKIFTARVSSRDERINLEVSQIIQAWCVKHGLPELEVTCKKDFAMIELYDDRAYRVEMNTGRIIG